MFKQLVQFAIGSAILIACLSVVRAQDTNDWRYKAYIGYSRTDAANGVDVGGQATVVKFGELSLQGAVNGNYSRAYSTNFGQIMAGPQVSYSIAKDKISPFVGGSFGISTDFHQTEFTSGFRTGIDFNLGRYFIRPVDYSRQYIKDYGFNKIGFAGGFRF